MRTLSMVSPLLRSNHRHVLPANPELRLDKHPVNRRLRFGASQKDFHLFLKYIWAIHRIQTPPHCQMASGFDQRNQETADVGEELWLRRTLANSTLQPLQCKSHPQAAHRSQNRSIDILTIDAAAPNSPGVRVTLDPRRFSGEGSTWRHCSIPSIHPLISSS